MLFKTRDSIYSTVGRKEKIYVFEQALKRGKTLCVGEGMVVQG